MLAVLIRMTEVLLMSTHNICFHGEIRKMDAATRLQKLGSGFVYLHDGIRSFCLFA